MWFPNHIFGAYFSKNLNYSIDFICRAVAGSFIVHHHNDTITHIATDSRTIVQPRQALFIALKKAGNGHRYLKECYDKGVRNFIVSDDEAANELPADCNIIALNNTLAALQQLAAEHRSKFTIPVIGITGSNGKTVVKEWLYQLLHSHYNIVRSPKSYNSQIGVPLSVLQMEPENTLAIFEAGISEPGEMENLKEIIEPTIGIFTNVGEAHQVNFSTIKNKTEEKILLFKDSDVLIYNKDYNPIEETVLEFLKESKFKPGIKLLSWSVTEGAKIKVSLKKNGLNNSDISVVYNGNTYAASIPFSDKASVENAVHCFILMLYLGINHEEIATGFKRLHHVAMRLEIKNGIHGCTLINDSYNSDFISLSIALDTLNQQNQHSRKTVILSDIPESGKNPETLYKEVASLLAEKKVGHLIGIGNEISIQKNIFPEGSDFFSSTLDFLQHYPLESFSDEAILLKGGRSFGFEAIAHRLEQKAHDTILEINLNSIVHNLNTYRSMLLPGTKIMAMVKALSYGSGSYEIANMLQFHKADYLGVAYADEAINLRRHGISMPIMVMSPETTAFPNMIRYMLEPEIYSFRLLNEYIEAISNYGDKKTDYPLHLKIDTGMHRLGFSEHNTDQLLSILKNNPNLKIKSIFSHLTSTEIAAHDGFTEEQIKSFNSVCQKITDAFNYPVIRHILNSSGIVRFPDAQYDMVRLGLGLYGIDPAALIQDKLEPVGTLKTIILQIKQLKKGQTVGYSKRGVAKEDMLIATIGIGYADGFRRSLGNGAGRVLIHRKEAPTIGNICMDMCMIDISGIDAKEGDEVIVFGGEYPVQKMAENMGTIAYEALTGVADRVQRVYYKE